MQQNRNTGAKGFRELGYLLLSFSPFLSFPLSPRFGLPDDPVLLFTHLAVLNSTSTCLLYSFDPYKVCQRDLKSTLRNARFSKEEGNPQ